MLRHLGSYFVTAPADGRSDGSMQRSWLAPELMSHLEDGLCGYLGSGTAPTGVNRSDRTMFGVCDQDWHAIGGSDADQHTWPVGDQGISLSDISPSAIHPENRGRMNLF